MRPRTLDHVMDAYRGILADARTAQGEAAADTLVDRTLSATRWLSILSVRYLGETGTLEPREKIREALHLADRCAEITGTVELTRMRIWKLRQKAEIFEVE